MHYETMTEAHVDEIAKLYMDYYNNHADGCWTYEKAYRRIHQMLTIENSLCLVQKDDEGRPTGIAIGFIVEFDDRAFYEFEEILIFAEFQNKGYGKQLLAEVEQRVQERGASLIELICPDDEHHRHFYGGFGMEESTMLKIMKKYCKCPEQEIANG